MTPSLNHFMASAIFIHRFYLIFGKRAQGKNDYLITTNVSLLCNTAQIDKGRNRTHCRSGSGSHCTPGSGLLDARWFCDIPLGEEE